MNYLSKFRTTYLLALLAFVSISACKNSGDLSEQELYSIINEIIADDSLHVDVVCWKFKDLSLTDAMRNHFNEEDIAFMQKQKTLFKDKTIVPNALHWSPRRNTQQYSTFVDSVCNEGIVYHIAFPMVSADRKKVIIEFSEDCNCNMGSTGGKDLYEKRKGHWVKTERF
jgi:hypothetical protein